MWSGIVYLLKVTKAVIMVVSECMMLWNFYKDQFTGGYWMF